MTDQNTTGASPNTQLPRTFKPDAIAGYSYWTIAIIMLAIDITVLPIAFIAVPEMALFIISSILFGNLSVAGIFYYSYKSSEVTIEATGLKIRRLGRSYDIPYSELDAAIIGAYKAAAPGYLCLLFRTKKYKEAITVFQMYWKSKTIETIYALIPADLQKDERSLPKNQRTAIY